MGSKGALVPTGHLTFGSVTLEGLCKLEGARVGVTYFEGTDEHECRIERLRLQ